MHSSTSSFDCPKNRCPIRNWSWIWGLTLTSVVAAAAGAEAFWRMNGHHPSVTDSLTYWSYHRSRVSNNDPKHVVLLGASRIQLGFSTDVFQKRFPEHRLTQLAINARSPFATLRDLAGDDQFCGTVIYSTIETQFEQQNLDDQQEYVDFYHHQYTFRHAVESTIGSWLQSHFVILNPQLRLDRVLRNILVKRSLPNPIYVITLRDRSRRADYSLAEPERLSKFMGARPGHYKPPAPEVWMKSIKQVEEHVQQITKRGGKVVFVRFPTTGIHWVNDETSYPRVRYWDCMADFTSAVSIHFADVPSLTEFELPDTSHLDYRDSPAFTSRLLDEFEKHDVLRMH